MSLTSPNPRAARPGWLLLALLTLALLPLIPAATRSAAAAEPARIRIVHAVPDLGPVDVYLNGAATPAASNVPFFTVSDYISVPAGSLSVRITATGSSTTLLSGDFTLPPGFVSSLAARGTVAAHNVKLSHFGDDLTPPTVGKAKIRVVHLSANAPNVDVYANGAKVVTNLAFRDATDYLEVPAGEYTFGVAPTGGDVIYTVGPITLNAGTVYSAWANGLLGGSGARTFKVTPSVDAVYSGVARVRAIHAVPDIAGSPVDVYVDGKKIVTFDFFSATDYVPVYAGARQVAVTLTGQPLSSAVISGTFTVDANQDYSIAANGTASPADSAALGAKAFLDDNRQPAIGKAKLRVVHLSPDAPAVDVYANGVKVVPNLSYPNATGYLEVPPGAYTFGVAPAGGSVIYTVGPVTLEAGTVYTAWANGLLAGSGARAFKVTPTVDAAYPTARVRLLHASPGAPAVDVYVNGAVVAEGLAFGQFAGYLNLPSGAATVEIRAAGGSSALFSKSLTLTAGRQYTAAAIGQIGSGAAKPFDLGLFDETTAAPSAGKAKVRVVHLSPNAPAIDLRAGSSVLVDDLSYGNASEYLEVTPVTTPVNVTTGDGRTVVLSTALAPAPGSVSSVFAIGLVGDSVAAGQRLRVVASVSRLAPNRVLLPFASR